MINFEMPDRSRHLEIILDSANVGLWELTMDGPSITVHMDERLSALWGFTCEERTINYMDLLSLYHKDDLPRVQDELHYLIEHPNEKRMLEYRIWNEIEKSWYWTRSFGTRWETNKPGVYCILGCTLDFQNSPVIRSLTEQTQEANERTQIMLDEMPMCCNFWSTEHTITDCNEGAVKLFKMKNKQEYLEKYYDLMPEYQPCGRHSRELAIERIQTAFDEGRIVFEWLYRRPDGILIPSEVTLVRVKYAGGYIVVEYTRDLREHRKMMREIEYRDSLLHMENNVASILLQSKIEDFTNDLWKCMGMIANSAEADRVYIWKNHVVDGQLYCTQLYEWSEGADPMQGNDITVDVPYHVFMGGTYSLEKKLSSGKAVNGIVRNMPASAKAHLKPQGILSIMIVPLFLRENFWGFIGLDNCHSERLFTDIEENMLRSAGLLITHALMKNEMSLEIQAAEKEAKAASNAKSKFLSNMSHELRTPLNAIIGMTAIGKTAAVIERKNYTLLKIEDASRHMLGVINDILDMSKIEANKFELSEAEFNIENVLNQVINVVSHRVDEKNQNLSVHISEDIPNTLIGDDQRLAQVIANILSNAIKFTPEQGSISLDIQLVSEVDGLNTIQITVTDTGIGVSSEQKESLFAAFQQADSNTTRKYGGTGLGLTISKSIVEMMGGNIWVESEPSKGSTFTFTICVKSGNDCYDEYSQCQQGVDLTEDNDVNVSLNGYRILLVDDIEINREIVIDLLEPTGAKIECAENGEDAVRLFKDSKEGFDLILMDAQMPIMDGYEASRKIRAMTDNAYASQIPIIAMTADVFREDVEKCLNAGMNDHIGKPLNVDQLFSKIHMFLRTKNS